MTFIDTHSHIQFKVFDQDRDQIIQQATDAGAEAIIAVGTDITSSQKAIEIAQKYPSVYAAIGIHPHHVFSYLPCHAELVSASSTSISNHPQNDNQLIKKILKQVQDDKRVLEELIKNPKVLAVGETGIDTHPYPQTKYQNYDITSEFLNLQKDVFVSHTKLAIQHQKTLIIHNRGAADELLEILKENWDPFLSGRSVFHCCEPNKKLLDFAKKNHVYIGVDGDVTYDKNKQSFVKEVPLELLVLETDSPFFVPEPLKSQGIVKNSPKNLTIIADFLAKITHKNVQKMSRSNARALFKLKT